MKEIIQECRVGYYPWNELSAADQSLIEKARAATRHSYAPYSQFCVGAAVLLADGTVVIGCNQENAAYPSGLCAERSALFAAGAQYPHTPVVALAIAARKEDVFTPQPTAPCGACRQVILETETRYKQPIRILLYGSEGTYIIEQGATALLPLCFTAEQMGR